MVLDQTLYVQKHYTNNFEKYSLSYEAYLLPKYVLVHFVHIYVKVQGEVHI